MIQAWVLIVLAIHQTRSPATPVAVSETFNNPVVQMQEFSSQKSCEAAGQLIVKRAKSARASLSYDCVPK